jgi:Zn-finger nucleic acid-binding protein
MNCPDCKGEMEIITYEGTRINECSSCKGVWLDEQELATIAQRKIEKIDPAILEQYHRGPGFGQVATIERDRERNLACPKCANKLDLVNYAYDSGIVVDICPDSHGVYLDKQELDAIQAFAEKNEAKLEEMDAYYNALADQAEAGAETSIVKAGRKSALVYLMPGSILGMGRMVKWLFGKR